MRAWCTRSIEPGSTSRRRLLLGVTALLSGGLALAAPAQDLTPATLEVNRAERAELESLPGLGPTLVSQLLLQRQHAAFTDWQDLAHRVRGMGPRLQRRLSDAGLRVQGQALDSAASGRSRDRTGTPTAPTKDGERDAAPASAALGISPPGRSASDLGAP